MAKSMSERELRLLNRNEFRDTIEASIQDQDRIQQNKEQDKMHLTESQKDNDRRDRSISEGITVSMNDGEKTKEKSSIQLRREKLQEMRDSLIAESMMLRKRLSSSSFDSSAKRDTHLYQSTPAFDTKVTYHAEVVDCTSMQKKKEDERDTVFSPLKDTNTCMPVSIPCQVQHRRLFDIDTEKEKGVIDMREGLLQKEIDRHEMRKGQREEIREQLDEEERKLDAYLAEERVSLQKLHDLERQIDEKHARQLQEEILIEERIKSIKLKTEELVHQREQRLTMEKRIREKEEEAELYELRLQALRDREHDYKALTRMDFKGEASNFNRDWMKHSVKEEKPPNTTGYIPFMDNTPIHTQRGDIVHPCEVESEKKNQDHSESSHSHRTESERYYGKPYIPPFDGNAFEEWHAEVKSVIRSKNLYPEHLIKQSVRCSLKGPARKVLLTLQEDVSTEEIVQKLQSIYGRIATEDTDWQDFFTATQKDGESSTSWAIRLESILKFAVGDAELDQARKNKMLKSRFWKGLKDERLKAATRVSYESEDNFEKLRNKVRKEEKEISLDKTKDPGKITTDGSSQDKDQMSVMKQLLDRMKKLEADIHRVHTRPAEDRNWQQQQQQHQQQQQGYNRDQTEQYSQEDRGNRNLQYDNGDYNNRGVRGRGKGYGRGQNHLNY